MMTVSGLEMFTIERSAAIAANCSGITPPSTTGVISSIVSWEKFCCRVVVEDSLVVLAISWITLGTVSCRLVVMFTSLGRPRK